MFSLEGGITVLPILFWIGDFPVRTYGVSIAIAVIIGLYAATVLAKRRGWPYAEHLQEFIMYAMFGGILGGRLWEVAFTWDYFREHPGEILAVWNGGLSIQGAILGGLLVGIWYTRPRRINFWEFADFVAPGAILGQGIGRLTACVANGDAYGLPTGTAIGIVYPPGSPAYAKFGAVPLWPAEIFEGLWGLAVFALLARMLLKGERPRGTVFLWYVILYSIGRFSLEFIRGDSLRTVFALKAAQLASIAVMLLGAYLLRTRHQARLLENRQAGSH
jgi:phosphatidylglycerol:prolipoprotein diacylglycerol transferase